MSSICRKDQGTLLRWGGTPVVGAGGLLAGSNMRTMDRQDWMVDDRLLQSQVSQVSDAPRCSLMLHGALDAPRCSLMLHDLLPSLSQ
jgi:hypothetical protein